MQSILFHERGNGHIEKSKSYFLNKAKEKEKEEREKQQLQKELRKIEVVGNWNVVSRLHLGNTFISI